MDFLGNIYKSYAEIKNYLQTGTNEIKIDFAPYLLLPDEIVRFTLMLPTVDGLPEYTGTDRVNENDIPAIIIRLENDGDVITKNYTPGQHYSIIPDIVLERDDTIDDSLELYINNKLIETLLPEEMIEVVETWRLVSDIGQLLIKVNKDNQVVVNDNMEIINPPATIIENDIPDINITIDDTLTPMEKISFDTFEKIIK
jgi:hypothetical protein